MYKGTVGSAGIAIGKAYLYSKPELVIDENVIPENMVSMEIDKLKHAFEVTHNQIKEIRDKASDKLSEDDAKIFEAHLMILDDPAFIEEILNIIKKESISASNAVKKVTDSYINIFLQMENEYMKERVADIKDIGNRILENILNIKSDSMNNFSSNTIIVAHDLTPSDTASLSTSMICGFVTDVGGETSHMAIVARSLEIPAVLGVGNITGKVRDGDVIILDAVEGNVIVDPTEDQLEFYRSKKEKFDKMKQELKKLKDLPAITKDGRQIEVSANIGTPEEINKVIEYGGEGVGLFRTEFLYMNRDKLPNEEEQFLAYKSIAEKLCGKPVIIRTLDIGGDKKLPYLELPEEMNPFLGWRAIRISLSRHDIFKTQLRAILRASAFGNVLMMYPMISDISELREANKVLEEAKLELKKEGTLYNEKMKVGIMVEIPSAALTADIISKEVDFFSIGTNDLCQYTLAVDRMNERVSKLYKPFHPAILRLIKKVIESSNAYGKFTGICGEIASDPMMIIILVGLGLDELSMNPASIPMAKKVIRSITYERARKIAEHAIELSTAEEIVEYLNKILEKRNESRD
mgnify:CR=1 FL=1